MARKHIGNRFEPLDLFLLIFLCAWGLIVIVPFINVLALSFSTQREYLTTTLLLIPKAPTLSNYRRVLLDRRIWIGFRTTLLILVLGLPVNMFLTTSVAYGLSRPSFPGKRFIFYAVLFTMLFNGGIVPMYLLMMRMRLINSIWSVVFATGINTLYMIIMRSFFCSLPEALIESAKLDGAGEWTILFRIILPLSMPVIATMLLFFSVDRWNEWYNAMVFIRRNTIVPLQLVLRSIVLQSSQMRNFVSSAEVVVMLPVVCVIPILQRFFVKGVLIGAIKA